MNNKVTDRYRTRSSLLKRVRNNDDNFSWQEFFDRYWAFIYETATKYGLSDDEAKEVTQQTFIKLSHSMGKFQYDRNKGSFRSWLYMQVRWHVLDHRRKRSGEITMPRAKRPNIDQDRRTTTIERLPENSEAAFERIWNEDWKYSLQDVALENIRKKVDPKAFQVFELYVLQEWPVTKVASSLNVRIHQIYLAKHRIIRQLKKEVHRLITIKSEQNMENNEI